MDQKICRTCGQTNLPNETSCIKCGLNLGGAREEKTGGRAELPRTVVVGSGAGQNNPAAGRASAQTADRSNKKLLLILGGVGLLGVIGVFLLAVLGVGIYFYSRGQSEVAKQPPVANRETTEPEKRDSPDTQERDEVLVKMTDDDINKHINEKLKRLGVYTLAKAGTPKKKTFEGSNAEQYGLYFPKNERKEFVILSMATFESVKEAKQFVAEKAARIKKEGGKVIKHDDRADGDILMFNEKGTGGHIMDCNKGVCINVWGSTGKHTGGLYQAYYDRK
ncbi:MAG: hypothetical protein R2747_17810 [Pyrinomonadaceae bacterium]